MTLPAKYAWLNSVQGLPQIIVEGLALLDVTEAPGAVNNQVIIEWAVEIGGNVANVYKADSIPWCGLFAAVVCKRAGKVPPKNPLWALSWSAFGVPVDQPKLGDVLVFKREGGGHVAFYVAEDDTAYHTLGGNQGDRVSITRMPKSRFYAARRPEWATAEPKGRRAFRMAPDGLLSTNEA
jgi:uncharacterized protein (TIGR02594 family)